MPGVDPARIERTVATVLRALADEGPTAAELRRSRNRLEAAWRWEQEDLAGLAAGLGQFALNGDWRAWQAEHRSALAVGADDIRRVASTYLHEANLTAGWSLPGPGRPVPVLVTSEVRPREATPPAPTSALRLAVPSGPSKLADYAPARRSCPTGSGS